MSSFNRVLLLGHLTRDPELRTTPRGMAVCQFGLATNRKFKTEAGEEREEVTFLDLEAWGKAAELIAKWCAKGRPLFVEGRLRLDQWEDKTTREKRSRLKVVVENFQFLGAKPDAYSLAAVSHSPADTPTAPAAPAPAEDVPF